MNRRLHAVWAMVAGYVLLVPSAVQLALVAAGSHEVTPLGSILLPLSASLGVFCIAYTVGQFLAMYVERRRKRRAIRDALVMAMLEAFVTSVAPKGEGDKESHEPTPAEVESDVQRAQEAAEGAVGTLSQYGEAVDERSDDPAS